MVYMDASTGFQRYWPKFPQGWYCCLRPSYGAFEIALGYRWCSFGLTPPLNDTWGPSHTWEWLDLTQTTGAKRCTIQIICVWLFVYDYLLTFIRLQLYICGVRSYWIWRYRPNTWQKTLQGFGSGVPSALIFYNERIYIYIYGALDANTLSRHHKKSEFLTKRLSWPRPHGALIYLSERLVTDRRFPRRSQGIRTYVWFSMSSVPTWRGGS